MDVYSHIRTKLEALGYSDLPADKLPLSRSISHHDYTHEDCWRYAEPTNINIDLWKWQCEDFPKPTQYDGKSITEWKMEDVNVEDFPLVMHSFAKTHITLQRDIAIMTRSA